MHPQVTLIVGNEHRFVEPMAKVEKYVRRECKIPKQHVTTLLSAYLERQRILDTIWDAAEKARRRKAPLVVVYCGHGYQGGFCPNGGDIQYEDVAVVMREVPFMFVNSSCYSGSSIDLFKERGLIPEHGSIIADAPRDMESSAGRIFLNDVVESWRAGRPFMKRKRRLPQETTLHMAEGTFLDDGKEVILKPEIFAEKVYASPRREGAVVYETVRCGKSFDYLMFPK